MCFSLRRSFVIDRVLHFDRTRLRAVVTMSTGIDRSRVCYAYYYKATLAAASDEQYAAFWKGVDTVKAAIGLPVDEEVFPFNAPRPTHLLIAKQTDHNGYKIAIHDHLHHADYDVFENVVYDSDV